MLTARGFEQMFTPVLAHKQTLFGTGYFPFARDETYKLEGADLCLIGTSEQTLVGYHAEETIAEAELPLLYTAFSPCFRTEAGSYGRESKGAFRVHQFHKVEQIVFCRPDESDEWLARCQENIEAFMDSLELHYRVVRVCKGDMGAAGYKKFDTEAWFPGFGAFRETHSNTNLIDYQTRRMGAKIGGGSRHKYPHTISATMATDRVVLAILEQYQNQDGSITVPRVLRGPLGGRETVTVEAGVRSFIED
jgi:seryl-tRNA synthetase